MNTGVVGSRGVGGSSQNTATTWNPMKAIKDRYLPSIDSAHRSALEPLHRGFSRQRRSVLLLSITLYLLAFFALAGRQASAGETQAGHFKLIELYTSLACSQCPAAEKLFSELIHEHEDLLALEFHVDYWNDVVHGAEGNFIDPYSNPAFSMRQREYFSGRIKGRPGVYTPQAIINGRVAMLGSKSKHVRRALSKPEKQMLDIQFIAGDNDQALSVAIDGSSAQREQMEGTQIMLVSYIDSATTTITGGENNRRTAVNHRIVTELSVLGEVTRQGDMLFSIAQPASGSGCMILVQDGALTPVYAAASCP